MVRAGDGDRDGAFWPKTLARWLRLTLLSAGNQPDRLLLEDAVDIAAILAATGRTIRADRWCIEAAQEINQSFAESFF
jgi:hypothetical protein